MFGRQHFPPSKRVESVSIQFIDICRSGALPESVYCSSRVISQKAPRSPEKRAASSARVPACFFCFGKVLVMIHSFGGGGAGGAYD